MGYQIGGEDLPQIGGLAGLLSTYINSFEELAQQRQCLILFLHVSSVCNSELLNTEAILQLPAKILGYIIDNDHILEIPAELR